MSSLSSYISSSSSVSSIAPADEAPNPILYAAVSHVATVIADFRPSGPDSELSSLAASFIAAPPQNHALYTHTAEGRIRGFVVVHPFVFFAIADEAHGRQATIQLLSRLRDAFSFSPALKRLRMSGISSPHCLQNELLPVLRRVVSPSRAQEEKNTLSHSRSQEEKIFSHILSHSHSRSSDEKSFSNILGHSRSHEEKNFSTLGVLISRTLSQEEKLLLPPSLLEDKADKKSKKKKENIPHKEKEKITQKEREKENEKEKKKKKKEIYYQDAMAMTLSPFKF